MILDKEKFKKGITKIAIAMTLAFIGPVLFVLGSGTNIYTTLIGGIIMACSFIIGLIGLKEILTSFFEKPSE
jgi:hypothetical protein